jgi:SAM-dependent methyltransferase
VGPLGAPAIHRVPGVAPLTDSFARAAYDRIAALYEWDMARNMPFDDVAYYVRHTRGAAGPVLELGCGTGRVTLPLIAAGLDVVAADVSGGMLAQLSRAASGLASEARRRLRIVQMDMRSWPFHARFGAALLPFSTITYAWQEGSCAALLAALRKDLRRGGLLIVDAFIPRELVRPGERIHDYSRELPDGRTLRRSKVVEQTAYPAVRIIHRTYELTGDSPFTVTTRFRAWRPQELAAALVDAGFGIEAIDYDYAERQDENAAQFATIRARVA